MEYSLISSKLVTILTCAHNSEMRKGSIIPLISQIPSLFVLEIFLFFIYASYLEILQILIKVQNLVCSTIFIDSTVTPIIQQALFTASQKYCLLGRFVFNFKTSDFISSVLLSRLEIYSDINHIRTDLSLERKWAPPNYLKINIDVE